ncbi:sensor histidine kinase [Novosphingobium lentum]|uniref:sensor histidine kinase n=1 Tax=Novosphingobium lentum TaxID=145287 RepID=UPI00146FE092|nr:histidine kinase [Novosphingobium lentum]
MNMGTEHSYSVAVPRGKVLTGKILAGRSSRVMALCRLLLAYVFLLALWLDPVQPARGWIVGTVVLLTFIAWSTMMVIIAWRSWWFDSRLALPAHVIDIMAFNASVYFTEAPHGDFSSPFMAFFVLLLVKAAIRWDWRATAWTAVVVVMSYFATGAVIDQLGVAFDLYRYARRISYMSILALVLTWLVLERRSAPASRFAQTEGLHGSVDVSVIVAALSWAREEMRARGAAIAWSGGEEPWTELRVVDEDGLRTERWAPVDDEGGAPARGAEMFDRRRHRILRDNLASWPSAIRGTPQSTLPARLGIDEGLVVPIHATLGSGELLLWGVPGACIDDLQLADSVAREIALAMDRAQMAQMAHEDAVTGVRTSLARDLHDSVAQSLAGTAFRIEALRRWILNGNDPEPEIAAVKEALHNEQLQVRLLIDRLRKGEEGNRRIDLADELPPLLEEVGRHWQVSTGLSAERGRFTVPAPLSHELRQMLREAVANAARHGRCARVEVTLGASDAGLLMVDIDDDGVGFASDAAVTRPRSISERVAALGGNLDVIAHAPGTGLRIQLPWTVST